MTPTLLTITMAMAVALTPVCVNGLDSRIGQYVTLSEVGMTGEFVGLGDVQILNMDVKKIGEVEAKGEGKRKEEVEDEEDDIEDGKIPGEQFITNGHATYSGTFQHQAHVLVNTPMGFNQLCGAVLLSSRHALTAAHCTVYMYGNFTFPHFLAVAIHNRTLGLLNPGSQMVPILHFKIHRRYNEDKAGRPNDLAILYLGEDIVQNEYVHFAELATPEMGNFDHQVCVISGWGWTENGRPDMLQFGYQYIPTLRDCRLFWKIKRSSGISKKHICGYYYPTSGCFGDSGGPLTCGNVVAGIVSWGLKSCSGCVPLIYTRVSSHLKWIVRNTKI